MNNMILLNNNNIKHIVKLSMIDYMIFALHVNTCNVNICNI